MHLIIFVWGFTGILGKLIRLDSYSIVWYRVFIAFISLWLVLAFLKKPMLIRNRKHLISTIAVGVIVACHWLAFYKAIQLSTVSLGVLCLSTTTLHVSWLEPLVMKRKFSWIEFLLGLLVIYGIYIVSEDFSANDIVAMLWGLSAAFLSACFAVFNARLAKEGVSSSSITLYEMGTAVVFITLLLLAQGKLTSSFFIMTWSDFYWLLFLGIICTSCAFLLMIEVVKKIGAFSAALTINLEPVYTIILAIFILGENQELSMKFYWGALMIIFVVFLNPLLRYWVEKRQSGKAVS